ncbi:MAG TPA: sirohydrochlorin cobaltochelatase [Clostridiales bacterium]|nr:sirohydrochlorin cobaltochelatase [Clostridiales bacterium]
MTKENVSQIDGHTTAPAADIPATTKGDPAKKAILVASFGTSYNDSREKTIGAIEKAISLAYPGYALKRAFTSRMVINKLKKRDGLKIDNVDEAMCSLVLEGYGTVIVQPTHVMNGYEYEEMLSLVEPYKGSFEALHVGSPLLTSEEDYARLAEAVAAEIPETNLENTAVVLMGHGTDHFANSAYAALDYRMKDMGYHNIFIGTVENYPDLDTVKKRVAAHQAKKVVLYPLMIVAGDHANNDMAGDGEGSWKTAFEEEGYEVECILKGLGEYEGIRRMFVERVDLAIAERR